jgi:hypothetical protein
MATAVSDSPSGEAALRFPTILVFRRTALSKTISTEQIRGFFRADSQPRAAVIIRPNFTDARSSGCYPSVP